MSFEPIKHQLPVTRTARYFMSAPIGAGTRKVWLVLHGYAQHAGFFLRKFEPLFTPETVFVAPEALSRFYLRGNGGKVVASWMTSEDRLDEINDYIRYLDQLVDDLKLPAAVEVNVLGFSQGVATAARWVAKGKIKPAQVILYAGVFPPDLEPGFDQQVWKTPRVDVLVGDQDEFYQPNAFQQTYEPLKVVNPLVKFHVFEGGHEIFAQVLRHVME